MGFGRVYVVSLHQGREVSHLMSVAIGEALLLGGGGGSAESTGLLIILKIEGNFTLLLVPIKQEKEMMPIFRTTLLY